MDECHDRSGDGKHIDVLIPACDIPKDIAVGEHHGDGKQSCGDLAEPVGIDDYLAKVQYSACNYLDEVNAYDHDEHPKFQIA